MQKTIKERRKNHDTIFYRRIGLWPCHHRGGRDDSARSAKEGRLMDMMGSLIAAAVTVTQGFTAFAKGTASTVTIYGLVKKGASKAKKK